MRRARRRSLTVGAAAVAALGLAAGVASATGVPIDPFGTHTVGTQSDGSVQLPDNQMIKPLGQRIQLAGLTIGSAVSPDGTKVAVQTGGYAESGTALQIVDAATGKVLQTFGGAGVAAPVYSPDGTALYAAAGSSILKYTVGSDGLVTNPTAPQTLSLTSPYGLAVSADGKTLYAALSTTNKLAVVDTASMQQTTAVPVGNAPAAVAIVGNQAFVSNRGGRPAQAGDTTDNSAGTPIVTNPKTGAASTGTVSVVDLATNTVTGTVKVGLQPTSLTVHDGSVLVTNTNSDTVSIIDATSHKVTQTFNVEPLPGSTVGSSPNSVTFAGKDTLLVSVGGDNSIAEFSYAGPRVPVRYEGLIPTDWYPTQVTYDAKAGKVLVGNQYGVGSDGDLRTHTIKGTVTSFAPPAYRALGTLTKEVFHNNGWDHLPSSNNPAPRGQSKGQTNGKSTSKANKAPGKSPAEAAALPAIPTRLGQPSAIKHVFLIVKENRTYDAVLGDLGKGNGDPTKATLGVTATPNEHSLANTFTDFDNFYDPSQQSPDGHSWILQADPDDYLAQDQAAGFQRSYPYPGGDPLVYQRDGFLWNAVEAAGKSVKDYGEYTSITTGTRGTWQQYYADSQIMEGKASGTLPIPEDAATVSSDVPSVNDIIDPQYVGGVGNLGAGGAALVPDQYNVDVWNQDFQKQLTSNSVPNLTVMSLPADHTGGAPTPQAQVADNDLAVGRIISDISHSKVWKDSAVFIEEDDTQNDTDHVDGHRGPLFIASPYARRGVVDSSFYSQINVTKTIEQILGAQPMNQVDRAAVPMFDAFTNKPNDTPYTTLPNQVPLTQGVTGLIPLDPPADGSDTPAQAAALKATSGPSVSVPADEKSVEAAWATWDKTVVQPSLATRGGDSVNPAQLDRYDWYYETGWVKPYPGDSKILAPDQVPGRNLDSDLSGD